MCFDQIIPCFSALLFALAHLFVAFGDAAFESVQVNAPSREVIGM